MSVKLKIFSPEMQWAFYQLKLVASETGIDLCKPSPQAFILK